MSDQKDKELDDLLEEMGIEAKEVADNKIEAEALDKEESKEETVLNNSKKKLTQKISDLYTSPQSREKFEKRLKTYDSAVEWTRNNGEVESVEKIVPDVEKVLFPYYVAGSSVRAIWQQFGKPFGFSLATLYKAKEFYLWEERKKAIGKSVMTEQGAEIATRFSDYLSFFDDLMGEAIIRFKKNSDSGQNTNPFNQLKVQNVKDLKDLTELMMNITGMKSEGKDGRGQHNVERAKNKPQLSDKKAAKLLEILAEDDEEEED
jgi:hypothetical protein